MTYTTGQKVRRLEDRNQVGAVILAVKDGVDGQMLELSYEEGGTGWWPADAVEPDELA